MTLSDKIIESGYNVVNDLYDDMLSTHDVKEAIKELLCPICLKFPENNCSKCNKFKIVFGKELCE